MQRLRRVWARHKRSLIISGALVIGLGLVFVAGSYVLIGRYGRYVVRDPAPNSDIVGIVFGGGVENGQPRPLLQDRLDAAADLLTAGKVRALLLSGDNRFVNYNEPQAMFHYLVDQRQIDPGKLHLDNAGRSTYETCERARKIFDLTQVVLISESTHLPRAIYLCRSFGLTAFGYQSDGQSSAGLKAGQRFREVMARTKATLNVYVVGERTVLGDKIPLR